MELTRHQLQPISEGLPRVTDAALFLNHDEDRLKAVEDVGIPIERRALLLWEPPSVHPAMYSPKVLRRYGLLLCPSPVRASRVNGRAFDHPYLVTHRAADGMDGLAVREGAVLVQANKFSAVAGELYTLRRRLVLEARRQSISLSVYGWGWDVNAARAVRRTLHASVAAMNAGCRPRCASWRALRPNPSLYMGEAIDKARTLSNYKVSVVIENYADYVSEKLYDAIEAGTVALYVGPPLTEMSLPTGLAVNVEPNLDLLVTSLQSLLSLPPADLMAHRNEQRAALDSLAPRLSPKRVSRAVVDILDEHWTSQGS